MSRIGIGVIGIGVAAANAHLPVLSASPDFELLAIMDRDPARLEYARGRWPIPHAYTQLEALLANPGIHAVVVATPPDSHLAITQVAIECGKHVLAEKPLASTLAQTVSMIEMAKGHGVCLCVGHEKRFHPTFEKVRSLLQSDRIGTPYYCGVHWASNVKLDPDHLIPEGYRPGYEWRWRNRDIGGGIIQDHLPHYADLIRDWTNSTPAAVYCQSFNVARDLLGVPPEQAVWEDLGLVVVRFSNGLVMRFETGTTGRSLSPLMSMGSGIGEWTEYGYILGTRGQLLFDLMPWDSCENGRIAIWRVSEAVARNIGWSYVEQPEPKRREGSPAGASHTMFTAQAREFAKAIRGEPSRIASGVDGAITVAAVDAAYLSAQNRQECPVAFQG
jgi:predicted dehydrogenase